MKRHKTMVTELDAQGFVDLPDDAVVLGIVPHPTSGKNSVAYLVPIEKEPVVEAKPGVGEVPGSVGLGEEKAKPEGAEEGEKKPGGVEEKEKPVEE